MPIPGVPEAKPYSGDKRWPDTGAFHYTVGPLYTAHSIHHTRGVFIGMFGHDMTVTLTSEESRVGKWNDPGNLQCVLVVTPEEALAFAQNLIAAAGRSILKDEANEHPATA